MKEFSSTFLKNQWGQIADAALKEPVTITKHGRASHVVMSSDEYLSLRRMAFIADTKAKLAQGKRAAENGEFSSMTLEEMKIEARRRFEAEDGRV